MQLPSQYNPQEAEPRLQQFWEKNKIYKFEEPKTVKESSNIYSIDTPPPYASADHLHVGHGMHYSQFEFMARYKRMQGYNVFFPIGFDDNGLPTERYVEKKYNLNKSKITRSEFIKLCLQETKKTGQTYRDLFTRLGFSIDWNLLYHTIGTEAIRVSQKSFLDLYQNGHLERTYNPTTWCTTCQTTIAQADLENVDLDSSFNDINFKVEPPSSKVKTAANIKTSSILTISTTRPELLPACVALCYNPQDKKYKHLAGKSALVPIFNYKVPILADENVDPTKGTGLMMVCTFGDKEDIEKWHRHKLPLRIILAENGRLNDLAGKYSGLNVKEARKEILADLRQNGELINQKNITHSVNVHERCGQEIEFLKKQQWQIKVLDKKEELLKIAEKVSWYPQHMKVRYDHWVKNLQWNWGISRQRYYGVPFPVWYCQQCGKVLLPKEKDLPIDPREQKYTGKCSCGSIKIEPEMDVMDTWMTSSVTPEINSRWGSEDERKEFLPMSLRPQAHDIIRTWAFYTLVKSYLHHQDIPWKNIMISGHGQDPKGQKMSKSKGNFIVAQEVIKKYSADAFRFWAASVKLGDDLPYQEKDVLTGHKFVNKLWNASKFCLMHLEDYKISKSLPSKLAAYDQWLLSKLNRMIKESTESFENYEYFKSKSEVENFFWHTFCDNYLEIVKDRLYNPDQRGNEPRQAAQFALSESLLSLLKLISPIMPHITEEVYQLYFNKIEGKKSIHLSSWPKYNSKLINESAEKAGDLGVEIISLVRKYKSESQMSLKEELSSLILISKEKEFANLIKVIEDDLKAVLNVKNILFKGKTCLESDKFRFKLGVEK
ncbi:MAG TPA: valine--tRNA ligase [Candidatus Nanoarchaeia archaeon]|nr:valine--tRNA ligase [Candidatus Nanoarchaeia archaeon]